MSLMSLEVYSDPVEQESGVMMTLHRGKGVKVRATKVPGSLPTH